jgi:DNA-binding FrmR family transcriptional regulator
MLFFLPLSFLFSFFLFISFFFIFFPFLFCGVIGALLAEFELRMLKCFYYRVGGYGMSHTHSNKDNLIKRIRRIQGQLQAIERALEGEADCGTTLHLVAAARGAMNGLTDEVIEAHAHSHVADPQLTDEERAKGVAELLEAIRRYSK